MGFSAYKFRDQIAMQDCGYLSAFYMDSAASVYRTGGAAVSTWQTIGGSNNFHKLVYRMYLPMWNGTSSNSHGSISLYLCSLASSLTSLASVWSTATSTAVSVSSNWGPIDSANCYVNLLSASNAANQSTHVAVLEVRPEKFSSAWNYVTPFISATVGAAAFSTGCALVCDAYLTDYGPASNFDSATIDALETDYL